MTRIGNTKYECGGIMDRKVSIDVAKGLLILLVVMAHYRDDATQNEISGYPLSKASCNMSASSIVRKRGS